MSIASRLDKALRAVCPIDGVSIGIENDKQTWSIQFSAAATAPQRAAAQALLAAFDVNAQGADAAQGDLAAELTTDKALDDLGRAIDQGDTKTALTLVKQLLQEKR